MIAGRATACPESRLPNTSGHSELHRYRRREEVPGAGHPSPGNRERCLRGEGRRASAVSNRYAFRSTCACRHRNGHPGDSTCSGRTSRHSQPAAADIGNWTSAFWSSHPDGVGVPGYPLPQRGERSLRFRLQRFRAMGIRPPRHAAAQGSSDPVPRGTEG